MDAHVIASTEADSRAAAAVEQHHAQLAGALTLLTDAVLGAAMTREDEAFSEARDRLVAWCRSDLLPHAMAEEKTLYLAGHDRAEGRLLVDAMVGEHVVIHALVEEIAGAATPLEGAAAARALQVFFGSHLEKENTLLLPLLTATTSISLADLLVGMHELAGESTRHGGAAVSGGHDCTCSDADVAGYPELDARGVPHAIRHATIFGALDGIYPGSGLVLIAPHDPKPLLAQVERRNPGAFSVEYLQRGPETWRLAFVKRAAAEPSPVGAS